MIEATNAINASSVRASAQASAVVRSQPVERESLQRAPAAPFISPRIRVDVEVDKAILEYRDGETGEVIQQYPSEKQLAAFQRAEAADSRQAQAAQIQAPSSGSEVVSIEVSAPEVSAPAPVESGGGDISVADTTTSIVA